MDAKKKKNRKKKGNNQKAAEDSASTAHSDEISILDNGNGSGLEDDNHSTKSMQDPGSSSLLVNNHSASNSNSIRSEIQSVVVPESDVVQDRHKDETNNMNIQEEVRKLRDEGNTWQQKQVGLEDKVEVLLKELNIYAQNGAILEEKFKHIQNGNDLLIQKQALLDDKVSTIDAIKYSVNTTEISLKEMISKVEERNMALQVKVKELEESRNSTIEENQQLLEKIALLESRIELVEKDMSSCSENLMQKLTKLYEENNTLCVSGGDEVVNKLATENAEITSRKLEEPYTVTREPDPGVDSSALELNHVKIPDETSTPNNYTAYHDDKTLDVDKRVISVEDAKETADCFVSEATLPRPLSSVDESRMSEEIVTVPLDEIEIHEDESQEILVDDNSQLPFSDAPLIGAPFRLFSFVTRYVSGADLVNHNDPHSGR